MLRLTNSPVTPAMGTVASATERATMVNPFKSHIAAPAKCPSCAGDVFVPMLKAYRYAGEVREHAGTVADCAQCGLRLTLMRDGRVLRLAQASAPRQPDAPPAQAGGHETGRPGWLDPDMVTLPTHAGGF